MDTGTEDPLWKMRSKLESDNHVLFFFFLFLYIYIYIYIYINFNKKAQGHPKHTQSTFQKRKGKKKKKHTHTHNVQDFFFFLFSFFGLWKYKTIKRTSYTYYKEFPRYAQIYQKRKTRWTLWATTFPVLLVQTIQ